MKSFEGMLARRKFSTQRLPKRNNITLDGNEGVSRETSPKNKISKLISENVQRVQRANSIQNLIQTCKNINKKQVRFQDIVSQMNTIPDRQIEFSLFSQIRNSKQDQHKKSVDTPLDQMEFRLANTTKQRNAKSTSQFFESSRFDFKLEQAKRIEKLASEVETDSENFLKQSLTNMTQQQEKQIRSEVVTIKEKALLKLKNETESLTNLEGLIKSIKTQINQEIDKFIDQALSKRKNLYELAQMEVKAYFLKLDSKSKSSSTTGKKTEGTPCFDDKNSTNSRRHKETQEKCSVRAFDSASNSNNNSMSSAKGKLDLFINSSLLQNTSKRRTQENKIGSSNKSKDYSESSRFTFTIDSHRKHEKSTKGIKDRIICGKQAQSSQDSVVINQFSL